MSIKFSIIMPNYNSKFLKKAIKSVLEQSYKDWELIIIDNFSKNFPKKIIDEFNDSRIHFYKFNNENNIAKSRNYGISKAKYEWIAFLDSDDIWTKNKIIKVKKSIETFDPDFVYHGMYYLPKKFGLIKNIILDKSKEMKRPIFETLIKKGNGIANSSAVVKKSLLKKINFLSEDNKKYSWEDYDCWIRCAKQTDKFYFVPDILGYCWVGGGNISNLNQSYLNYKNFHEIYKDEIIKLTNRKRLDWYNKFLLTWYFKKKRFNRAYLLQKKFLPNDLKSFLKSILIKLLFLFSILKKKYVKKNR